MDINTEEKDFRNFFKKNANGKNRNLLKFKCIQVEKQLYPAEDIIKREFYERDENGGRILMTRAIGRIDLIFKFKQKYYCGEIKYQPFSNNDFWDALKILGYTSYLNWQEGKSDKFFKPAIFMPDKKIRLEHKIVSGLNGVMLIGIVKESDNYYSLRQHT